MYNELYEDNPGNDVYDNLLGIKLKGLFKKKDKSSGNENSDKPARKKDGSGFKKFISGLGSAVSTGTDIYSNLKSAGGKSKSMPKTQSAAPKNNNSLYYIIGGVLFIVIIVTVIISVKK